MMKDLRQYFTARSDKDQSNHPHYQHDSADEIQNATSESDDYVLPDGIPYVVRSMEDAIQMVLADEIFKQALTDTDRNILQRFCSLNESSKLVLSRLFGRVKTIFRKSDLSKFVQTDLNDRIDELLSAGLLSTALDGVECETLLKILNRQELQELASRYNVKNHKKLKMHELVSALLTIASKPSTSAFFGKASHPEVHFRKQLSRVLGACWRVEAKLMRLLSAVLWLSGLGCDTAFGGPQRSRTIESQLKTELYNMMLVRRGDVVYPSYQLQRQRAIYRNPTELEQYLDLLDCQLKMEYMLAEKQFDSAASVYNSMRTGLLELVTDSRHARNDLPVFLRRFTAPYRAFRLLLVALDLLERQRRYEDAVSLILSLIFRATKQQGCKASEDNSGGSCPLDSLGPCRVGRLLIRLLVNEGHHLKRPEAALDAVHRFLSITLDTKDSTSVSPCIRAGLRLGLQEQLTKVAATIPKPKVTHEIVEDDEKRSSKRRRSERTNIKKEEENCEYKPQFIPNLIPALQQAPKVEIRAPVNASSTVLGTHRPHYLWFEMPASQSQSESASATQTEQNPDQAHTLLLTVEQWTLRHYTSRLGYECGIHSESRIFHLIFVLLFYDILFDQSVPDVFYSYRQTEPLDLCTDDFYSSRRSAIDNRLAWILEVERPSDPLLAENEPIAEKMVECWTAHCGERCVGASWDLLSSPREVSDLFWCLGPKVVHAVCQQLATDFRNWRSGLPDLVVWSPGTHRVKIIEVKGPGDHLSTQQMMWLDVLVRAGADVEISHIIAVSQKSLQNNNGHCSPCTYV